MSADDLVRPELDELAPSDLLDLANEQAKLLAHVQDGKPLSPAALQAQSRLIRFLRNEARRRAQPEARDYRPHLKYAAQLADLFAIVVPPSPRPLVGEVVTLTKRAFVGALKPFHVEVLRPQRNFNEALVTVLAQLLEVSPAPDEVLSTWAVSKLEPLNAPTRWQVKSHREGPAGRAMVAMKRKWLESVGPQVEPLLEQQSRWNTIVLEAAPLISRFDDSRLTEAHDLIGALNDLGLLLHDDVLGQLPRGTRALWSEVFRQQQTFNGAIIAALVAFFDLPRRPWVGGPEEYAAQVAEREPAEFAATAQRLKSLTAKPLISIVTPTYNSPAPALRAMIDSVLAQQYENWELCLHDDGSTNTDVASVLAEYARRDPRVRYHISQKNEGIALATNRAISMARGEFIAFADHDDALTPHALAEVALYLNAHPQTDFLYSDEDRLDLKARRAQPFYKPDWSPDLLQACNYVCHLLVVRRTLLEKVGRLRAGFDGSQDYDLVLRLSEQASSIGHIPKVLYHWRATPYSTAQSVANKPSASQNGQRALREHLARVGSKGVVESPQPTNYRVDYPLDGKPLASIIIGWTGSDRAERSLLQLLSDTAYSELEVLVVGPKRPSVDDARVRHIRAAAHLPLLERRRLGAAKAGGQFLVFVDEDLHPLKKGWLKELIAQAQRPGVGVVAPLLLHADETIEQAGWAFVDGHWTRPFEHFSNHGEWTSFGNTHWARNLTAAAGGGFAVRRELFDRAAPALAGNVETAAVRLSELLRAEGMWTVLAPQAQLVRTPGRDVNAREVPDVAATTERFFRPGEHAVEAQSGLRVEENRTSERRRSATVSPLSAASGK